MHANGRERVSASDLLEDEDPSPWHDQESLEPFTDMVGTSPQCNACQNVSLGIRNPSNHINISIIREPFEILLDGL